MGLRIHKVGREVVRTAEVDHTAPAEEAVRTVQEEEEAVHEDPAVRRAAHRVDRRAVRKEGAARRGSTAEPKVPRPPR